MYDKYLIFISDKQGVFPFLVNKVKEKIEVNTIYKDNCNQNGLLFKVLRKFRSPFISIMFNKWKKSSKEKEYIIIFDTGYNKYAVKKIKKLYKNSKIILYFWNKINDYSKTYLLDKNIDEFYSFDHDDSQKYSLNYNPQFYIKNIKIKDTKQTNDVLFLGRAKNRKEEIEKMKERLDEKKVSSKILIIEEEKNFVPYDDYLKMLSKSKTILDIIEGNQIGLTLRCMESIFFEKKLITNNKNIVNYDFYNKENIFILGIDNIDNIDKFVKTPYKKIDKKIVNNYEFENWLKRFGD